MYDIDKAVYDHDSISCVCLVSYLVIGDQIFAHQKLQKVYRYKFFNGCVNLGTTAFTSIGS